MQGHRIGPRAALLAICLVVTAGPAEAASDVASMACETALKQLLPAPESYRGISSYVNGTQLSIHFEAATSYSDARLGSDAVCSFVAYNGGWRLSRVSLNGDTIAYENARERVNEALDARGLGTIHTALLHN